MKRILFIRHAKSDWSEPFLEDVDRPLNSRGKRDAPEMGKRLNSRHIQVDIILSSPSKRTKQTLKLISAEAGWDETERVFNEGLYLSSKSNFLEAIESVDNALNTMAIVSHNPGTTYIVNYLSNSSISNIPTCGMALIEFDTENWKEISGGTGKLVFYDFPKNI